MPLRSKFAAIPERRDVTVATPPVTMMRAFLMPVVVPERMLWHAAPYAMHSRSTARISNSEPAERCALVSIKKLSANVNPFTRTFACSKVIDVVSSTVVYPMNATLAADAVDDAT
jgi:hypothetical protein